jgi:hypothetical protein
LVKIIFYLNVEKQPNFFCFIEQLLGAFKHGGHVKNIGAMNIAQCAFSRHKGGL